jgi:hypothetical protein
LFAQSTGQHPVNEYHVDSTFKTNQHDCELFAVIGSVNDAGFPIAYLYFRYTRLVTDVAGLKKQALVQFFSELQRLGIRPVHMLCDKDASEIGAITEVWGENSLRLCLWHLQQAVERALRLNRNADQHQYNAEELRDIFGFSPTFAPRSNESTVVCPQDKRREIRKMMTTHYCSHHLFLPPGRIFF